MPRVILPMLCACCDICASRAGAWCGMTGMRLARSHPGVAEAFTVSLNTRVSASPVRP